MCEEIEDAFEMYATQKSTIVILFNYTVELIHSNDEYRQRGEFRMV